MNASTRQLQSASRSESRVEPTWRDGSRNRFHAIWLRDICPSAGCGDSPIGYRKLRLRAR